MTAERRYSVIGQSDSDECFLIDTRNELNAQDLEQLTMELGAAIRVITTIEVDPELGDALDQIKKIAARSPAKRIGFFCNQVQNIISACLMCGWRGRCEHGERMDIATDSFYAASKIDVKIEETVNTYFAGERLPQQISRLYDEAAINKDNEMAMTNLSAQEGFTNFLEVIRHGWNGASKEIKKP